MHHPPIKAIIFDFDGTLALPTLDFTHMKQRVYATLANYTTAPIPAKPALECIEEVCSALPKNTAHLARQAALQAIVDVEVEAARHSSLFPFTLPTLHALQQSNVGIGIITRNCHQAVHTVFPNVMQHVACLLTRHDVTNVKPHPQHLEKALQILHCPPQCALMVGDHPMDILVGQRAGTLTGAVCTGEGTKEHLQASNPTYVAQNIYELMHQIGIPV